MTDHHLLIDATGTVRRLQALVAAGWPKQYLAADLGMLRTNIARLMQASTVTVRTACLVRAMYDRLWDIDPATRGATSRGIHRAKNEAEAAGWARPAAWDDDSIDNPGASPDWTGSCGRIPGFNLHIAHGIPLCEPCRAADERRRQRNAARELRAA